MPNLRQTCFTLLPLLFGGIAAADTAQAQRTTRRPATPAPAPATRPAATSRPAKPNPNAREGLWFSGGLGLGSLGCSGCNRQTSISGTLSAGTTLSPRLLVGGGIDGWTKTEGRTTLTAATLDGRIRFYPAAARGRVFLTGGLGLGSLRSQVGALASRSRNRTGGSALIGGGIDLRISPTASVTPYANLFTVRAGGATANIIQIGAAFTAH
jgi:hypothetical protein